MRISKLEVVEKIKTKVYIDEEYHFLLYPQDMRLYKLEEGMELTDEEYKKIIKDTVLRRGKQKALTLLEHMDRTEYELILKLKISGYSQSIIDTIIAYVKSYHYIDDARYASQYIRYKKESKSKKQIQMELMQKGIASNFIEIAMDEEYFSEEYFDGKEELEDGPEDIAIKKAIYKKIKEKNIDELDEKERTKLMGYLYRKGFSTDLIRKHMKTSYY